MQVVKDSMLIDTTLRRRLNLQTNQSPPSSDEEVLEDTLIANPLSSGGKFDNRFSVSAQEWLSTWRITE